ncbi:family 1 glycosylhydrolase [Yinghuangia aomiensis]
MTSRPTSSSASPPLGHQIEGNNVSSDCWALEQTPDTVFRHPSGDAMDFYHRWPEDIRLTADLGFDAVRFSLEWARIEPEPGQFSNAALDHYLRIAKRCHELGLRTVVTFNHWTTPIWFAADGGWTNPRAVDRFARYVERAAAHMAGEVDWAVTLNEPNVGTVAAVGGGGVGGPAVGNLPQALEQATRRHSTGAYSFLPMMLWEGDQLGRYTEAHQRAREIVKSHMDIPVGWSLACVDYQPVPGCEDRAEALRQQAVTAWLEVSRDDDFVGVQNYTRRLVGADGVQKPGPGTPVDDLNWELYPQSLTNAAHHAAAVSGRPVLITEHGLGTSRRRAAAGTHPPGTQIPCPGGRRRLGRPGLPALDPAGRVRVVLRLRRDLRPRRGRPPDLRTQAPRFGDLAGRARRRPGTAVSGRTTGRTDAEGTGTSFRDAGAVFIGSPARATSEEGDPAVYFRREFDAAGDLLSATLRVTALGIVEPYVNGAVVGDEVLEPGWTSYRHRLVVRRHDITALVRPGANAFGAIVAEGWATGKLGYEEIARRRQFSDRVALFAVIELRYPDRTEVVVTDDGFRTGEGAVRAGSIYDGVTIDARLDQPGWNLPQFDDHDWEFAEVVDWDPTTLTDPVAPPIRRIEELAPHEIRLSRRGTTIVDFGQNISGWVRLKVRGSRGQVVTVRHAETVVAGEPDYTTLRTAQATDRFVLVGTGTEEFEPTFTYHGFRYAEIAGLADALSVDDVRAVVVHSDMTRTGWFTTSNPLVNRLHENVVWSMRDNFVGLPTDCPQRDERLGWTGDINAFAPTATFLYDVSGVLRSWLEDLAAEQQEFGYVPFVVPDVQHTFRASTALWSDVAVSLPWALYWEYGDIEILRRCYDSMAAFTRGVEALLDENGVWSSGFQFGDWLDSRGAVERPQAREDRPAPGGHFLLREGRTRHGADGSGTRQHRRRGALRRARRAGPRRVPCRIRHPRGRIVNESATAYALAIEFGLLDADELPTARPSARRHSCDATDTGFPPDSRERPTSLPR